MKKPGASVFWVSARNDKEIEASFCDIANKLPSIHNDRGATAESAAEIGNSPNGVKSLKKWMLSPGHEDWLLVLDNFDDIEVKLDRFLPIGASGSVLITTRDRNVIGSVATSGFHLTAIDLLDAERLFLRIQNLGADPHLQEAASGSEISDLEANSRGAAMLSPRNRSGGIIYSRKLAHDTSRISDLPQA